VAYVPMPVLNGSAARLAISRTRHIHAIFRSVFEHPFSLQVTEKPSRYWIKVKNSRYSQLEGREELFERV
jgi:hypothetical protein